MGFFGKSKTEPKKSDTISTAAWQSLASGGDSSRILHASGVNDEENNFVNPEGPLNLGSSAWDQERQSQQLELDNIHHREKERCCSQFMRWTIKALHVTDVCLGMALIIYGSLLRTQFEQPAMAAVVFCFLLGSIILVASVAGIFSYASPSCSRWGLLVSGFVAPYLAAVYVTMIIALVMDSSGFFMYLEDHHDVMYMGENVVENLNRLMPLLYTLLGLLLVLELTSSRTVSNIDVRSLSLLPFNVPRAFVVLDTRQSLLAVGVEDAPVPRSGYSTLPSVSGTLNEPLLDEKMSSTYVSDHSEKQKEVAETPEWWTN
ncbi:hypothetical protein HJC23_003174 [Cyclotella cryptica]|uniref:Transmembrane protein n=1 Tax=Cyclotella cryptica TaxID=29204 RepID=A0ABD3PN75_9STRA